MGTSGIISFTVTSWATATAMSSSTGTVAWMFQALAEILNICEAAEANWKVYGTSSLIGVDLYCTGDALTSGSGFRACVESYSCCTGGFIPQGATIGLGLDFT